MHSSNGIRGLITGCMNDERTLRLESAFVSSNERRILLRQLATERGSFVEQLKGLDSSGRQSTRATVSWIELLREFRRTIRRAMGGRNDGDAIADCRRSRKRTEGLYEHALTLAWRDEKVLPMLLDHYRRIGAETDALIAVQF